MDFKNPSCTKSYMEWLIEMEAIYYPVYNSKELIVQYYFEPTVEYLEKMQKLLGHYFFDIVQYDKSFIKEKNIWNKHPKLIPYLFPKVVLTSMQTKLFTNDYKDFIRLLQQGAPLDIPFVDNLVETIPDLDKRIYALCMDYASVKQFFHFIHSKDVDHIKMILDKYPEYMLASDRGKSPFFYAVEYGMDALVEYLIPIYDDVYEIFDLSLNNEKIATFMVDHVSGFSDEQANQLVQKMMDKNLLVVCNHFSKLYFKVDFHTQRKIMDHMDFFKLLKDKFDFSSGTWSETWNVIQECISKSTDNPELIPMVEFYKIKMSQMEIKPRYTLKF